MALYNPNLLFGLFDEVNTVVPPLPRFNPVQGSPTFLAIKCFKRSHLDTLLVTIVVRELCER
jgi:hypothetical protein